MVLGEIGTQSNRLYTEKHHNQSTSTANLIKAVLTKPASSHLKIVKADPRNWTVPNFSNAFLLDLFVLQTDQFLKFSPLLGSEKGWNVHPPLGTQYTVQEFRPDYNFIQYSSDCQDIIKNGVDNTCTMVNEKQYSLKPVANSVDNRNSLGNSSCVGCTIGKNQLSVSIGVSSNPISLGKPELIVVSVGKENSSRVIPVARINGAIVFPSERDKLADLPDNSNVTFSQFIHSIKFSGLTDNLGNFEYPLNIGQKFKPGIYSIVINTSSPGYDPKLAIKTFVVERR